jgi:2-polyprenyl-3-methyl-5-hydroxy-6-metoxy-1,4-benzoquinol methylase
MEGFDEAYASTSGLFGNEPEAILVRFADELDRGVSVLDVGCGQGRHALWLAQLVVQRRAV